MKKNIVLSLVLCLVFSMMACSKPSTTTTTQPETPKVAEAPKATEAPKAPEKVVKEAKDIKIAIVNQNQGNPVFLDLEVGAKDKAKELGIQFEWTAPPTADAVAQAEMIESIANKGVDAIGVVP